MEGTRPRAGAMLLLTALGAALGLGACAAPAPPLNVAASGFGQNATGVVQFWDRNTTSPFGKLLVDQFNATHKNLKVVLTPVQDTQYVTKLATAIRAGDAPDLVGIDDINSQLFIYHKVFADLTPLVNALPGKNELSPGALNLTTENGRYYGVPYVADMSVLWYNKTLFRRAGLDPNKPPTSYAQILSDAKKITALGHGIYGFAFPGRCEGCLGFTVLPDIWATGKRLLYGRPGHETAFIQGNVPLRETLSLYRQLWTAGLSDPQSQVETDATWGNDFLAGDIGMSPLAYGPIAAAPASFRAQLGMTLLPAPSGGATATFDGGANFGIPLGSQNPSGAWEFIKFALQQTQQSLAPSAGFEPIRSDVLTPRFRSEYPFAAAILAGVSHGYAPKTIVYNTTFNQPGGPWLNMFDAAVFDGDIAAAMRAGQASFATAIDLGKS
ncbi:MAG: sugar ABC transporter substrate-binding protein [Streptosporangiaceae bacterium]|nr:sugar ABC transporter substrate-binding protein [Streptosporangiaceae bacterium]